MGDALLGGAEAHGHDGGPIGGDAHLQQSGEGAGVAGGVKDDVHTSAVGELLNGLLQVLLLGVDDGVGAVAPGALQGAGVDVGAHDAAALDLQGLEDDGADGAAAQDQDRLAALDVGAGGAVAADGEGLDQGRIPEGELLGHDIDLMLRNGEVLSPAAVDGGAAGLYLAAYVAAAGPALGALAAGNHQVHHHMVAHLDVLDVLADLHDDAGVLMAGDAGKHSVGVLAQKLMHIGAAHAGRLHLDQHLVVRGLGHGNFPDLKLLRANDDNFLHGFFHLL